MPNALVRPTQILDEFGRPIVSVPVTNRRLKARYDAAQTTTQNERHWKWTDDLDPHRSASRDVRQVLRRRSRYEAGENNPYLKGTILSICNDFVGSGPKLQITDQRLTVEQRQQIEAEFRLYAKQIQMRHKLWRMCMATIVDGETFARPFASDTEFPVKTDWHILEADRITGWGDTTFMRSGSSANGLGEIDGVRFDQYDRPVEYYVLNYHPGGTYYSWADRSMGGQWMSARWMVHWFRQDRGWLRGIPELTPSLELCAILRRYTKATLLHKEMAANHTAFIKTQTPAFTTPSGTAEDDPWDIYPVNMGLITTLPWDTDVKQLEPVPDGERYDEFVGSLLREIIRPLLVTYNIAAGTSQDANMASSVLDAHIYANGQHARRRWCEDIVLPKLLNSWWFEAVRLPGYLDIPRSYFQDSYLSTQPPVHRWRWDPVGLEHTDPKRVADSLAVLKRERILTSRDIQEVRYNRDVEEWRREVEEDLAWEEAVGMVSHTDYQDDSVAPSENAD